MFSYIILNSYVSGIMFVCVLLSAVLSMVLAGLFLQHFNLYCLLTINLLFVFINNKTEKMSSCLFTSVYKQTNKQTLFNVSCIVYNKKIYECKS